MAVGLSTDKRFQRTSGGLTVDGGMVVEEREQMKLKMLACPRESDLTGLQVQQF